MKKFTEEYHEFLKTHSYKTVTVSGRDFQVIDSGSGSHTIVFLNGIDMPHTFMKYMSAFEKNYRVLMMKYPTDIYTNNEMADALHELFGKLGISSPILFGISDGGVLGQDRKSVV